MIGFQGGEGIVLFDLLDRIRSNGGLLVLVLIAITWLLWHLFYRLLWKVWRAAMRAKDQEIERLIKELDKYQSIVFERLLGPDDLVVLTQKRWPESEGGGGNSSQDMVN